jgi:hypothetical protein
MLLAILFVLLFCCLVFLLNVYAGRATGISDSVFYVKCDEQSWLIETAWKNKISGDLNKIITTSNLHDGVVSILNDNDIIYHTKQPFSDRYKLQRFHLSAKYRFFRKIKYQSLLEAEKKLSGILFKTLRGKLDLYSKLSGHKISK